MLGSSPETRSQDDEFESEDYNRGFGDALEFNDCAVLYGARHATELFVEDLKNVKRIRDKNILFGKLIKSLEDDGGS